MEDLLSLLKNIVSLEELRGYLYLAIFAQFVLFVLSMIVSIYLLVAIRRLRKGICSRREYIVCNGMTYTTVVMFVLTFLWVCLGISFLTSFSETMAFYQTVDPQEFGVSTSSSKVSELDVLFLLIVGFILFVISVMPPIYSFRTVRRLRKGKCGKWESIICTSVVSTLEIIYCILISLIILGLCGVFAIMVSCIENYREDIFSPPQ